MFSHIKFNGYLYSRKLKITSKLKKMITRFVTPKAFSKIAKGKKVVDYPNEWIKDVNGVRYQIVNPEMKYRITELSKDSYAWYLGMTYDSYASTLKEMFGDDDAKVYMLECDWFPTELVAGIKNGRYSNTSALSRKTGWIRSFGRIELFRASCIEEALAILNKNHFMFNLSMLKEAV